MKNLPNCRVNPYPVPFRENLLLGRADRTYLYHVGNRWVDLYSALEMIKNWIEYNGHIEGSISDSGHCSHTEKYPCPCALSHLYKLPRKEYTIPCNFSTRPRASDAQEAHANKLKELENQL